MDNSINTDYIHKKFFFKMEESYKQAFTNLVNHYGYQINTLDINAGKTLYTRHDFNVHCINIYQNIDLFFEKSLDFLTPNGNTKNIFKLYLSVLFHDVGMTNFNMNRDNHSQKSVDYVKDEWKSPSSVLHSLRICNILNENDIRDINLMILAHSDIKDGTVNIACNGLFNPKFNNCEKNILIMAAILRLADELDCSILRIGDERRKDQLDLNDPEQNESLEHWEKLHCISKVSLSNEDNRFIILELNDDFVEESIDKDRIFTKYLPEIVNKIQKELNSINENVFNKSYCNGLAFRAEYVKIDTQKFKKNLSSEILYNYNKKQIVNNEKFNTSLYSNTSANHIGDLCKRAVTSDKVPDRRPLDSTYVTMRSSVSDILRIDSFSNKSIFWEKNGNPGMFYDYASDDMQTVKGRITLNHNETAISANKLDAWIAKNWLSNKQTFIHLLVGYAGCGKSTFVNHILNSQEKGRYSTFWNFYDIQEYCNLSQRTRMELYLKDNLCYNIAKRLKSSKNKTALIERFKNNLKFFRCLVPGVSCNVDLLITELKNVIEARKYNNINIKGDVFITEKDSLKLVPFLALTYLWNASIQISSSYTVICVFDGLDIIDDPRLTVDLIKSSFLLMKRYRNIKSLPDVKLIITCRKFTLSLLETSSGDVSFGEVHPDYRDSISFLDISTLYQVSKVLKYKAKTICTHPELLNLKKTSKTDSSKLEECRRIANLPEEIVDIFDNNQNSNETLSFSKIVNHNLRSASSLYHILFSQSSYSWILKKPQKPSERICCKGFFVHKICHELNIKRIWKNMGYGGYDKTNNESPIYGNENEMFPTTLSRMILTKLYRNPSEEKSLLDLYNSFSWMPVSEIKKDTRIDDISIDIENKLSPEYFADCIADMLTRSSSNDDEILHEGIWRRPLYFGSRAISSTNISELKYIYKDKFTSSILEQQSIHSPTFKIAECGEEFIDTFAIHFEFNAVRFCNTEVPLWMVNGDNELQSIVDRVYNSVARCMDKQIWLADRYSKTHEGKYLDEDFHPKTNLGYDKKRRPQLHIIRVVFSHIAYLDAIRELLWKGGKCKATDISKIKTLNSSIGKYLNLLEKNIKNLKIDANSGTGDGRILKSMLDSYKEVVDRNKDNPENPYVKPIKTNF